MTAKVIRPDHWNAKAWKRLSSAQQAMEVVKDRIHGHRVKDIAEDCEVSTACIYAIRRGTTKWPRGKTLFSILEYLNLEMYFYDLMKG